MSTFTAETLIERPANDVWEYAADVPRQPEWMGITSAEVLRGIGTEAGARGRARMEFGPFRWDVEFDVVEALRGRRLLWRADDPHFSEYEVQLDLEPTGADSTRARYRGSLRLRGIWKALTPLLAMDGATSIRRELERLKANAEQLAVPSVAPDA
ncbi:MAG: SRPBCC family protein [Candidatus Limnocylindrales bacterium]